MEFIKWPLPKSRTLYNHTKILLSSLNGFLLSIYYVHGADLMEKVHILGSSIYHSKKHGQVSCLLLHIHKIFPPADR